MVKVVHNLTFQVPASRLFAALFDYEHSYRWQTIEVLKEWRDPEDGPIKVGTRVYQKRIFNGKPIESLNIITAFEQDRRVVAQNPATRVEYQVAPLGEHEARLDFSINLKIKGIAALFGPLIGRGLQKDVVERFQNLKRYLEYGESCRRSW
ncbi:MAG TPA: SRPBCC family protein [Ktedonosporobacter sp.]|nr:SRPBCC family protein [Ktedonosporobacter sp.]